YLNQRKRTCCHRKFLAAQRDWRNSVPIPNPSSTVQTCTAVRARPKVEMGAGSGHLGAWRAELGAAEIQWSERDQRLSREPSNAERDGQTDYDAVDNDP